MGTIKTCWVVMNKIFALIKLLILLLFIGNEVDAQITFSDLLEQAKQQSRDLVMLTASRNYLQLEVPKIKAVYGAPKSYISSEVLLAPYFNNNGQFVSNDPKPTAIGYDLGVTNGGLYSLLLNAEMPIFNYKQINNLIKQNDLEVTKIDTRINSLIVELKHSLALQYMDALGAQLEYSILEANLILLKQEIDITKALMNHGLYRYVDYRILKTAYMSDSLTLQNSEIQFKLKINQLKTTCGISDTTMQKLAYFEPEISPSKMDSSIFLQCFVQDSLAALLQQKVFENQYKPQVRLYANTGLNSTSIPYMGNHIGISAGVVFSYTLFDGRQKQINQNQQIILMDQAHREKELRQFEVQKQKAAYHHSIASLSTSIDKELTLQKEYSEILDIYNSELQKAQVGIMEYINFLQLFNQNKLALENHKIERNKLIIEYNYWNN